MVNKLPNSQVSAISPSFPIQEINDPPHDLINGKTGLKITEENLATRSLEDGIDLRRITYFSDGRFFNATLWLNDVIPSFNIRLNDILSSFLGTNTASPDSRASLKETE